MSAEDALSTAKHAALQALLSASHQPFPLTTPSRPPLQSQDSRRRKRKRRPQLAAPLPASPSTPAADISSSSESEQDVPAFEPEPLPSVDPAFEAVLRRFDATAKDPEASEESDPTAKTNSVPTALSISAQGSAAPVSAEAQNTKSHHATPNETTRVENADNANNADNDDNVDNANGELHANEKSNSSRRARKLIRRAAIAVVKAYAPDPSIIEAWDVSADDALLLARLKATPNSVRVPPNWRSKRKYLQNKRGLEKRPLALPDYIIATGVPAVRDAQREKEDARSLKQRGREKMRGKVQQQHGAGNSDVDEARLRDAFFKFQTKPRLSGLGEVYYELKELEVDSSRMRPGFLSAELRSALGMTETNSTGDGGAGKDAPVPWLVGMQRWGPPPGWPGLRVPGVNAPIPKGASFGFQPGGWGKAPIDAAGRPVYGDVFGEGLQFEQEDNRFDKGDKELRWGGLADAGVEDGVESAVEERGEEGDAEETGEDGEEEDGEKRGSVRREEGRVRGRAEGRASGGGKQAHRVLREKKAWVERDTVLGSSHVYEVGGVEKSGAAGGESRRGRTGAERGGSEREGRDGGGREGERRVKFKF